MVNENFCQFFVWTIQADYEGRISLMMVATSIRKIIVMTACVLELVNKPSFKDCLTVKDRVFAVV